jgi:hypothetical protein
VIHHAAACCKPAAGRADGRRSEVCREFQARVIGMRRAAISS